MKYTLYRYMPQYDAWGVYQTFDNKDQLVRFLVYGTSTGYGKRVHWTNIYMDNQNLTCKDITTNYRTFVKRDEDGNVIYDKNGFPVYEHIYERKLREWHLEDADGRTVDMRLFKDEVFDIVEQMGSGNQYLYMKRFLYYHKRKQRQGRPRHHTGHYRYSSKHHRYSRTINAPGVPDDVEDILTDQQIQRLKTKPKDNYAKGMWGDDFWTYGPTGWKEHKNRKQWEARVKRNDDSTWVDKRDKKTIAFEMNENGPAELSAGHCFCFFSFNANNSCGL